MNGDIKARNEAWLNICNQRGFPLRSKHSFNHGFAEGYEYCAKSASAEIEELMSIVNDFGLLLSSRFNTKPEIINGVEVYNFPKWQKEEIDVMEQKVFAVWEKEKEGK
jgi:hypothetical protein